MDAALTSLLGAVVGGGIASATNVFVEGSRTRREANRDAHRRAETLRTAARLVFGELKDIETLVQSAASHGYWASRWYPPERLLSRHEWEEHRTTIAMYGPDDLWILLSNVYSQLALIDEQAVADIHLDRMGGVPEPNPYYEVREIGFDLRVRIESAAQSISDSLVALTECLGVPSHP